MPFEYDPAKSAANKTKHGIDFDEAQELWRDPRLSIYPVPAEGERRYLCVGRIDEKHWTAVITNRGGNTRIISVRRARNNEIENYHGRRV